MNSSFQIPATTHPTAGPTPSGSKTPICPPSGPSLTPPALPLDERQRRVSPRVSLHPALLRYDVVSDDGAYVGRNHDSTIPPLDLDGHGEHGSGHNSRGGGVVHRAGHSHERRNWHEYWWYADPALAPERHTDGPGQVCYLHDMADIRNHRHHGLIGAVIIEPADTTPVDPADTCTERWTGTHVLLRGGDGDIVANEQVLFWQDGLRLYLFGNPNAPLPDAEPGGDPEDAGQKGISYGTALAHPSEPLEDDQPPTPIWAATVGQRLWLRLIGAADKPRNHSFTIHDQQGGSTTAHPDGTRPGEALSGLTADTAHNLALDAHHPGDHAYRSGVFRWDVPQGMWGILRICPRKLRR